MSNQSSNPSSPIIPYFLYKDGAAALDWLSRAFGFERTLEVPASDGSLMHAEMRLGDGYIMLGTATQEQRKQTPWDLPDGHGIYVHVKDVDEHFNRAQAAGAKIIFPPEDTDFGSRLYRVQDLDGYEWSFGTYMPGPSGD